MFVSRNDMIKFLRLMFSNAAQAGADEKSLLICAEIGKCAAICGRKTIEDFSDEELEETVGEVACIIYDIRLKE